MHTEQLTHGTVCIHPRCFAVFHLDGPDSDLCAAKDIFHVTFVLLTRLCGSHFQTDPFFFIVIDSYSHVLSQQIKHPLDQTGTAHFRIVQSHKTDQMVMKGDRESDQRPDILHFQEFIFLWHAYPDIFQMVDQDRLTFQKNFNPVGHLIKSDSLQIINLRNDTGSAPFVGVGGDIIIGNFKDVRTVCMNIRSKSTEHLLNPVGDDLGTVQLRDLIDHKTLRSQFSF